MMGKSQGGMGLITGCRRVVRDDHAQAMTEFVIVIPVILLVFFLMIQYFSIVQASQMGAYAAYCAGRVYAVRASWDTNAMDYAEKAACLAYAPVTKLAPGEAPGSDYVGNLANEFTGVLPGVLGDAAKLAEGYFLAKYVRLNEYVGGGSISISKGGDPEAVNVELNYAYPIFVPGLRNLWELTGGEKNMKEDLKSLGEDLPWIYALKVASPYPYMNVRSRCAMGYEDWSGVVRKPKSTSSEAATDPALAEREAKNQAAQEEYNKASKKVSEKAKAYQEALDELKKAQDEYNAVLADPNSSDDDKSEALQKLQVAQMKADAAKEEYSLAKEELRLKQQELEDVSGADLDNSPPVP